MEEMIARGGTFGLILALTLAVAFLIRLLIKYVDLYISELKAIIADVSAQRDRAISVAEGATKANEEIAKAIESRNRIEEANLERQRIREEVEAERDGRNR